MVFARTRSVGNRRHFGIKIMATQGSALVFDIASLSAQLLDQSEVSPRARIIAEAVTDLLSGTACAVYMLSTRDDEQIWSAQAIVGDVSIPDSFIPANEGALGVLARKPEPLVFSGKELVREQYAHLHVRRTLNSLAYLPLKHQGELIGAVEILSFDAFLESTLSSLQPIADIAARIARPTTTTGIREQATCFGSQPEEGSVLKIGGGNNDCIHVFCRQ